MIYHFLEEDILVLFFKILILLPALTVEENMVLPLTLDDQPVEEMKKKVKNLAEQLDLTSILEKRPC